MATICTTAAPYCYGPTAKLLCLADDLAEKHSLIFVGDEPGLSLARQGRFSEIIENSDRDAWNATARRALQRSDLLVSLLDYRSLRIASEYSVPSVFVDTLTWLRQQAPPFADLAYRYISQRFFLNPSPHLVGTLPRFEWVGPILPRRYDESTTPCQRVSGVVLVNFGGLRSPAMRPGADDAYVDWVLQLLAHTELDSAIFRVCLPLYLAASGPRYSRLLPGADLRYLDSQQFYDALDNASLLVTVPGLETIFEAIHVGIPLVLLPPYNGTQLLQMKAYQTEDIAESLPLTNQAEALAEEHSDPYVLSAHVQSMLTETRHNHCALLQLASALRDSINRIFNNPDHAKAKCERNRVQLNRLGETGRLRAVASIDTTIQNSSLYRGGAP
jgi:hypothetical protein